MKKKLLICFLFFTCFTLNAQIISLTPSIIESNHQGIDMTDNWVVIDAIVIVENMTNDTIQLKWEREIPPECNESWDTYICDSNLHYLPSIDTNWGPNANGSDVEIPFVLGPYDSYDYFKLHLLPRMNEGCCDMKIHFSLIEAPDSILATATFATNINMNDDCSATTTSNETVEAVNAIIAYPSPTTDFFQLTENEVVEQILIYNSIGQLIKTFNYVNGSSYDLTNEADGIYFVQLKNEKGEDLKLLPLVKVSN